MSQAMRGAFKFWMWLEEKYLPPYRIHELLPPISRLACFDDESKQQEIWDLWKDTRLKPCERLVIIATFDHCYLPFDKIPEMAEAMRAVHILMKENSNFGEQADALESIYKERKDVKAVAFNCTSVNSYTDVIGEKFDPENMSDIWESYMEAERIVKEEE